MNAISLLWIDWKLAGKSLAREWLNRFGMFFLLGVFLLAMLASGGINRFLSEQWVINAVLRPNVSAAEGAAIAAKAEKLPAVRTVDYKDPDAAWKEFLADYPGLESLRLDGGNPVPGYLHIRLLPERLTEEDIAAVENVLKPLPQIEKVFTGARTLPRLLKVRGWINLSLWGFFALLSFIFFSMCLMQERARARALRSDYRFLAGRGVWPVAIMTARAAGSAIVAALLGVSATFASGVLLAATADRFPALVGILGSVEGLARSGYFPWILIYLAALPCLVFVASLNGWRASNFHKTGK